MEKDAERIIDLLEKLKHESYEVDCNDEDENITEQQQQQPEKHQQSEQQQQQHTCEDMILEETEAPLCRNMSLGERLEQKENICPKEGSPPPPHSCVNNKSNMEDDPSLCGAVGPMSDVDVVNTYNGSVAYNQQQQQHENNVESRKYRTEPIPIPP